MYTICALLREVRVIAGTFGLLVVVDMVFFANVLHNYFSFYRCINKKPKLRQLVMPLDFSKIYQLDGKALGVAVKLNMAIRVFLSFFLLTAIIAFFLIEIIKEQV